MATARGPPLGHVSVSISIIDWPLLLLDSFFFSGAFYISVASLFPPASILCVSAIVTFVADRITEAVGFVTYGRHLSALVGNVMQVDMVTATPPSRQSNPTTLAFNSRPLTFIFHRRTNQKMENGAAAAHPAGRNFSHSAGVH